MTTQEMIATAKFMKRENFVSIKDLQKSPTKSLSWEWDLKFIMNNWKPMWVFLDYSAWEDILEDMEALSSEKYLKMIEESRKSDKSYSREEVINKFNLSV